MTLHDVACVICRAVFTGDQEPPIDIVEPLFDLDGYPTDAYGLPAVLLTNSAASRDYCRLHCPSCRPGSPGAGRAQRNEEHADE